MKLLLTSAGIKNRTIANALFELVGKKPSDTSLVFIPTASNVIEGDKSWVIEDLADLEKLGFKSIEVVDISTVEEKIWKPKLEEADILYFEGGYTYYLMEWINKSGLIKILPELLKTKIYVGASAGSMVAGQDLVLEISKLVYAEDLNKTENMAGLNLVNFYILPHLNSQDFKKVRKDFIGEVAKNIPEKIYALDDNSALKVVDGKVEDVSEGEWLEFN